MSLINCKSDLWGFSMPGFPENCQKLTLIMWLYGTLRGFALCSLYKQTVVLKDYNDYMLSVFGGVRE